LKKEKEKTQIQVCDSLHDQVQDFQRKRQQQAAATDDAKEKMAQLQDVIERRKAESAEMRRVIDAKTEYGNQK